jgi:site-specific recombinase XerD
VDAEIIPAEPRNQLASMSGATTDDRLIELWLHGRSHHTQRAYRSDVERFLDQVRKPLARATLADVQEFADGQTGAASTKARRLSSVKSLFAFGHKVGYLRFDVARAVPIPSQKVRLAERILPESAIHKMISLEENPRNHAMLRLLYGSAARVSELVALVWANLQEREQGGQVTLHGKGGKTRAVLLPEGLWRDLMSLRDDAPSDAPVFRSRRGGHLVPSSVHRIVRAAARRAGLDAPVSPHWFRHAHASHALDRGAPIHLVQHTLGHTSVTTTGRYLHARPTDSSSTYLAL